MRAAIVGIEGTELSAREAALFAACPPAGVILFGRNIRDPDQVAGLMADLCGALPADAMLMVDQEGGRVARLRPPGWRAHPAAGSIGALFEANPERAIRCAWLSGALIGLDCQEAGFDVAAAPVLDLRYPDASDVIGDRSFGADPWVVARLGRAFANGLMAAGVMPVGKHAPGHGPALVDSHVALPVIAALNAADLTPFIDNRDLPCLMTAHILFPALDPALPGTLSPAVIGGVIRDRIGFGGLLVTDDLAMKALTGSPESLAQQALAAGCDVALYCSGDLAANEALLAACPPLTATAQERLAAARAAVASRRLTLMPDALAAERDALLGQA